MLDFFYFSSIDSTQTWLIDKVKSGEISRDTCVLTDFQTQGLGSRENVWDNVENALMFSFAFQKEALPKDLPIQSISIYIGFLMKQWLAKEHPQVWLKWPNDFYLQNQKIGGILTQSVQDYIVCGIGINLQATFYASLNARWSRKEKEDRLRRFLTFLFKFPTWSYVFQNYKIEFYKNFDFTFHFDNHEISFCDVTLCDDGSVVWKDQKIYSLR